MPVRGNLEAVNGRQTHYGPRGQDQRRGVATSRVGQVTEVQYTFDWDVLPTNSATNEMVLTIPTGAIIERAVLVAVNAANSAAGTDALNVNAVRPDGTGSTSLLSTTRASLATANATVVGAGAGLNTPVAGRTQIQVTAASYTAGRFVLDIAYRAPAADTAGTGKALG